VAPDVLPEVKQFDDLRRYVYEDFILGITLRESLPRRVCSCKNVDKIKARIRVCNDELTNALRVVSLIREGESHILTRLEMVAEMIAVLDNELSDSLGKAS